MDQIRRAELEQRRIQLQTKMAAEALVERHIAPMQTVFDYLKTHGVSYRIAGLVHIDAEYRTYVEEVVSKPPYTDYGFDTFDEPAENLENLLEEVHQRFPSTHSLRYVPELAKYGDYRAQSVEEPLRNGLQSAIVALDLPDQPVYLHYLRYAPVLELSLYALQSHDHDDLFNTWYGDTIIFDRDKNWLIAYTLEDEWFGGR